jgi:hypothetical protein
MSNDYDHNPMVLDTFSAAIDIASSKGFASGTPFFVNSIEWSNPATVADTCVITDKASGNIVFSEVCSVAKQSIIKYFYGQPIANLCIAISGVSSGKVIITLV